MRPVAAAVLAALAAAFAATAAAAPSSTIRLSIGDAVDVVGTKVACYAISSGGKNGVACVLLKGSKPMVGSFGVGLAFDGTAVLNKIKPNGTAQQIFKRRLQGVEAATKVYRVHVGDLFGMPIDSKISLGCRVINVTDKTLAPVYRGMKVGCWRATASAQLPNSYGVSISDKFAGVFAYDAHGNVVSSGLIRRQPA